MTRSGHPGGGRSGSTTATTVRGRATPGTEVEERFGSVDQAPGVEPATAVAGRALAAWTELTSEYHDGPLVMVSHDAFNTALLHWIPAWRTLAGAGCYNQLSRVEGSWCVDFYDRKPE